MEAFPRLERVIVVPRNGYANRLQAWASATILAAQLDVAVAVLWEPEPAAPAEPAQLFDPELMRHQFIDSSPFESLAGVSHPDLPRYLSHDRERGTVVLAGHDRGEQVFIPELLDMLGRGAHTVIIIAGGQFHLPGPEDFARQRALFYSGIRWSPAIDTRVAESLAGRAPFAALHIRGTDRSLEAPTTRQLRRGLLTLGQRHGPTSLFVTADTHGARARWSDEAARLGFQPWSLPAVDVNRQSPEAGVDAVADWRILAAATAIVHPAASTFSTEAAVASGHPETAIPLQAPASLVTARSWLTLGRSAVTYPSRQWKQPRP